MRHLVSLLACVATPALAAPGPIAGSMDGWRFAICQMHSVCYLQRGRCGTMPGPGNTYIWRDETGLHLGSSARAAVPVIAFTSPSAVQAGRPDAYTGAVLVIPPEAQGPGWMEVALFDLRNNHLSDRFFELTCETRSTAPQPTPQRGISEPQEETSRPEVPLLSPPEGRSLQ